LGTDVARFAVTELFDVSITRLHSRKESDKRLECLGYKVDDFLGQVTGVEECTWVFDDYFALVHFESLFHLLSESGVLVGDDRLSKTQEVAESLGKRSSSGWVQFEHHQ